MPAAERMQSDFSASEVHRLAASTKNANQSVGEVGPQRGPKFFWLRHDSLVLGWMAWPLLGSAPEIDASSKRNRCPRRKLRKAHYLLSGIVSSVSMSSTKKTARIFAARVLLALALTR